MFGRSESSLARRGAETGIGRFDPWAEIDQMRTRMDELFSKMFGYTPLNRLIGPATFSPAIDVCESSDSVLVNAYVPGLTKDDVDLNVTPTSITLTGEWKHPHFEGEGTVCHVLGMGAGKFEVSYDLPAEIDPSQTKAVYRDGVLRITLPKTEASKRRAVKIQVQEA